MNDPEKSLEMMNDEEFRQFAIFYSGYIFSQFLLQERMEHKNNDTFITNTMASIVMDTLLNPLRQVLGRYDDLIKVSKEDRWQCLTPRDWNAWVAFKTIVIEGKNDEFTRLAKKKLFEDLFLNEWNKICKYDENRGDYESRININNR